MSRSAVARYVRPPVLRLVGLPTAGWTAAVLLTGLVALELAARFSGVSSLNMVPPSEMVEGAIELLGDRDFVVGDLARTLATVLMSFVLAAVLGVAAAYLMSRAAWMRAALQPYLNVFYALPIFALYPVLVVLFGTGMLPVVLLATTFSIVAVIANSLIGFGQVPSIVQKLSRSLELDPRQHFRLVLLPAALPDILAGLKLALGYDIIAVLASEFILAPHGLGREVSTAYNDFDTPHMYAGVLLIVTFALGANLMLGAALARFDWRRR